MPPSTGSLAPVKDFRDHRNDHRAMDSDVRALIEMFAMSPLPVEGTLYASTYRSAARTAQGGPAASAIVGLYAHQPLSYSCFHRLASDEIWHVYGGDPFRLILLDPDGSSRDIVMGSDVHAGQRVQFTVPAATWQAGHLLDGGRYALYGCTMAPGFTASCFEAATADQLADWPDRLDDIARYALPAGHRVAMPPGFG